MEKIFFGNLPARDFVFYLKSEKGHIGSYLTTTLSWGPRGRCRIGMVGVEVYGGDLDGGESERRVGAICFYFPQPLRPVARIFHLRGPESQLRGHN